jgi:hypothetical protein
MQDTSRQIVKAQRAASALDDLPSVLPADEPTVQITALPSVLPAGPSLEVLPADELPCVLPAEPSLVVLADEPVSWFQIVVVRPWRGLCSVCEWLFGVACLIVALSILASLPILQFLSLGYLLEASGRVARSGRIRDGFPGVRKAARVGSIVLGTWLMLLPLRLVSSMWVSAQIIDPYGPAARGWRIALTVLASLAALHIAMACARGGKLRYFFWPFNFIWVIRRIWRGGFYSAARDAVWDFVMGMRLPYYFWLGCRGFMGAMAWLAIPISLLALGRFAAPVGFLGAFLLMFVLLYVPFLQMQFVCENRLSAMFNWLEVRRAFRRAPWAFAFSFFVTLLFAVPLYLLKIEIVPREAAGLESAFFIAFMFPARLLTGWAFGRSRKRALPRHWFFRWTGRFSMIPLTVIFVIIVFFTQYISWHGVWSLYEQHAFLLPVPFVGM